MSTVKQVAAQKNQQALPKIDTIAGITDDKPQSMPSTLPTSAEATVLVNPNLQVNSEELKQKLQDEQQLHLRLVRLKLKRAGKGEVFENSSLSKKAASGKESTKKRNKHEEPAFNLQQEREKITLGKRAANQIEIEFDKEAIIEAEKASLEKSLI